MYCAMFIWEPGDYDAEFHRLNALIDEVARALPGYLGVESWQNADGSRRCAHYYWADLETLQAFASHPTHQEAKRQYARWYKAYHIVITEVLRSYGDSGFAHITPNQRKQLDTGANMPADRQRVGLVTSQAFADLYEDDRLLVPALAQLGIEAVAAVWDDPAVDWSAFSLLLMRSPWDYFERVREFRAWLDRRIAENVPLCNSADILAWNFDKRYLQELEAAGVALVPTCFVERGERPDVAALARAQGWEEIVVKPSISGGAFRTHRFRVEDTANHAGEIAAILADRDLLIQPFLPEIVENGELTLLFFDGEFSHAVCKRAPSGEYRVQFQFGGTFERVEVDPALVAQARACALAAPSRPSYARVDGVIRDDRFLLMELEVFEPLMFLAAHPEAPARFARAVQRRLAEMAQA